MALKKKPVTGMKDILPGEMEIRDYVLNIIKDTYRGYGFSAIETPCVEHIENLTSKQGGDNEKLIFKILKRGEKLNVEAAQTEADVVDGGLRYDLTLPLSRYYANNSANLSAPFKALQVGSVWRADRPQKGRFRQFVQCDIDILGDATNLAEIEEILALTKALKRICPDKAYTVRVNDRAILKGMADYSGFPENETDKVFIILDKMDKIGLDGVREELLAEGYAPEAVEKYTGLLAEIQNDAAGVRALGEKLSGVMDPAKAEKLIGKFTGVDTPACGFSIGFERIITILMDSGFKVPEAAGKKAFLYEKGLSGEQFRAVLKKAQEERANGTRVAVAQMNKNKKFQKEQLAKDGYEEIVEFYKDSLK